MFDLRVLIQAAEELEMFSATTSRLASLIAEVEWDLEENVEVIALDQSFSIDHPLEILIDGAGTGSSSDSAFTDFSVFTDCGRISLGGAMQQADRIDSQ